MYDNSRGRILVVDDDPDNADSLAMLLRANNYDAYSCHESNECLEAIERLRPDAVLLDLAMPGLSGYQIAEYLHAHSDLRPPLLVAVTGYGAVSDRQHTRACGFDYHFLKPVAWQDLDSILKAALSERMAHQPS